MKYTLILLIICSIANSTSGQTFSEWFRQQKTQKKYLLEQIAAFQSYLAVVKKGYAIVQKGSESVFNIKEGDSVQHQIYIQSLSAINPAIRHSKMVTEVVQLQQQVLDVAQYAITHAGSSAILTTAEALYVKSVFQNLLNRSYESLLELQALLTPGRYRLTDAERIRRINSLYADMQVKYSFAISFKKEESVLRLQRLKERADIQISKRLNDLP